MDIEFIPREVAEPHQQLVDGLLQVGAAVSQIVEHMATVKPPRGNSDPLTDVITGLLDGVLEPLAAENEDRVQITADVVAQAHRRIADELFLVPHASDLPV